MTDWTIAKCAVADLAEVADLVNAAYRGEGGLAGWTSEVGMVDGPRTTAAARRRPLRDTIAIGPKIRCSGKNFKRPFDPGLVEILSRYDKRLQHWRACRISHTM